jgi:hypothetical protein
MSRWKAAAIHLSISACVAAIAAGLIFGLWYPPAYRTAAGADQLVLLLIGVDITLGPLLTLVVYKAGKWGLRFDLAMIALFQCAAFLYGMSVVTRARPAFVVAVIDRFVLVPANDLDPVDLAKGSKPEFRSLSWTGPRLVGAQLPTDEGARTDLLFSGLAGKDIDKYPEYYVDYATAAPELLTHAKPIDDLIGKHPQSRDAIETFLVDHDHGAADTVWVPVQGPRASVTMFLDRPTGTPLGALPLDPW